jgi:hemolysin III
MSSQPGILTVGSALRSPSEEFIGAATHGVGALMSVAGTVALMAEVLDTGRPWTVLACAFYCLTLVGVYTASTLSHVYLPERWNRLFRALDQGFIYLLIVGTFTPFALTYLESPAWLAFYAGVLAVAVGGFLSKTVFTHRLEGVAIWLYVALGWGEAAAIPPMLHTIPMEAFYWIVAGGLFYTVGTIFLVLDIRKYHFHAIWHVLVIAGSICHYWAIFRFVAQAV